MEQLKTIADKVRDTKELVTCNFTFEHYDYTGFFEARVNISEFEEVLIIIRDMTERMQMEMKLREMAELDSLTKLYNRHCFMDRLNLYNGRQVRDFTVLLIDIDGLKLVNDTMGHSFGDSIIMTIANIVKTLYQDIGFVSRVGGGELGIIIEGCSQDEIEKLLERMDEMIREYNEKTDIISISVSAGYSYQKDNMINGNQMYQEADNNMYQSKLLKESSNRSSLVKALMKTLEVKDYITEGHADRLEDISLKVAKALKLPQHQVDRIKLLAKFHDIGKVGIPDRILMKPGSLTEEEWKIMKTHSVIGKRIAEASPELSDISTLIFHHHEKFDGTGYPLGLKGMQIPIECRILSIVDTFDAITNDRPYRKAQPAERALEEIARCSGTQFDPMLVRIFEGLFNPLIIKKQMKNKGLVRA